LLIAPTAAPNAAALSNDAWRWVELQAGVAWIEPATVDQFVPQMLNLEVVGGVDFKKGCYPGQEVVARSQYRGTLKRRAFLFDLPAGSQAAPGQEIVDPDGPSQPVGMVVNAAAQPGGHGASLLAELKLVALARADAGALRLVDANGPALQRRELAYAVPLEAQDIP
jgi:folate-binding protein YgfZ